MRSIYSFDSCMSNYFVINPIRYTNRASAMYDHLCRCEICLFATLLSGTVANCNMLSYLLLDSMDGIAPLVDDVCGLITCCAVDRCVHIYGTCEASSEVADMSITHMIIIFLS